MFTTVLAYVLVTTVVYLTSLRQEAPHC